MRWEGQLVPEDLSGDVWILRTDEQSYQLVGVIPPALSGAQVVVEGTPAAEDFGFAMVGPVIEVRVILILPSQP